MTTIAYRSGVLAADTQVTDSADFVGGHVHKVGKTKDGCLWGFTGSTPMMAKCAAWANGDRQDDPPKIDASVLVMVSPDGALREWYGDGWVEGVTAPFHTWGAGRKFAMGAMHAGATASAAVAAAIAYDIYTGGEVIAVRLGDAP